MWSKITRLALARLRGSGRRSTAELLQSRGWFLWVSNTLVRPWMRSYLWSHSDSLTLYHRSRCPASHPTQRFRLPKAGRDTVRPESTFRDWCIGYGGGTTQVSGWCRLVVLVADQSLTSSIIEACDGRSHTSSKTCSSPDPHSQRMLHLA